MTDTKQVCCIFTAITCCFISREYVNQKMLKYDCFCFNWVLTFDLYCSVYYTDITLCCQQLHLLNLLWRFVWKNSSVSLKALFHLFMKIISLQNFNVTLSDIRLKASPSLINTISDALSQLTPPPKEEKEEVVIKHKPLPIWTPLKVGLCLQRGIFFAFVFSQLLLVNTFAHNYFFVYIWYFAVFFC